MNLVYANASCSITDDQGLIWQLRRGEMWDAADPLVKARPKFFSKRPITVRTSEFGIVEFVEQATAAPGEKRTIRR